MPYLCPCDAPWTSEYRESYGRRLDPEYDDLPEDDDYVTDDEDSEAVPDDDQTRLG